MSSLGHKVMFLTIAILTFSGSIPAATAQIRFYHNDQYDARYRAPYAEDGYYCVPQCREDFSPCDPLYYKRADGRCSGDNKRR
jgi:hypothetical protein